MNFNKQGVFRFHIKELNTYPNPDNTILAVPIWDNAISNGKVVVKSYNTSAFSIK